MNKLVYMDSQNAGALKKFLSQFEFWEWDGYGSLTGSWTCVRLNDNTQGNPSKPVLFPQILLHPFILYDIRWSSTTVKLETMRSPSRWIEWKRKSTARNLGYAMCSLYKFGIACNPSQFSDRWKPGELETMNWIEGATQIHLEINSEIM